LIFFIQTRVPGLMICIGEKNISFHLLQNCITPTF